MKVLIKTIQHLLFHNRLAIRYTIFMIGCNLYCKWYHCYEVLMQKEELEWIGSKCIDSRFCVEKCQSKELVFNAGNVQFDKNKCSSCFYCIQYYFLKALYKIGRKLSSEESFIEIEQDLSFFKEWNGEIIFSGVDPIPQAEFIEKTHQFFHQAKIYTANEYILSVLNKKYNAILPLTGPVLIDVRLKVIH